MLYIPGPGCHIMAIVTTLYAMNKENMLTRIESKHESCVTKTHNGISRCIKSQTFFLYYFIINT